MTAISAEAVKELRNKTGISVIQCKRALEEAGGDMDRALEALKRAGAAISEKKKDRNLGSGTIGVYIHADGMSGTLLELLCETDFVAKNEEFQRLAKEIAMHITAMKTESVAALLEEDYVRDPSKKVRGLIEAMTQKFGERIEIGEFSRLSVS